MKKVATFLTIFLCLSYSYGLAQGTVQGKVINDIKEAVSFATVALQSSIDSSLVKADISDMAGSFLFSNVDPGSYYVQVTYVGFQTQRTETFELVNQATVDLSSIIVKEETTELDQVVVTAVRPLVEIAPDKTVFNVAGSINASGSDALELLRKAPGVVVDNNDRVMLMGKSGVKIYIDGKKSPLSAEDLADYLKSLQSNEIDAFEIITNPSAKFEAEGNAGIINIRIKKDKSLGTNGTATSTFRQGITAKTNNAISFNHRNMDYNLFGRYGNSFGKWRNVNNIHRLQVGQGFDAHGDMINEDRGHQFRMGSDFFINKKSTLGFLINGSLGADGTNSFSRTRIYDLRNNITSGFLLATNQVSQDRDNGQFNANYAFDDGDGTTLNVDVDYGLFRNAGISHQPNEYWDAEENNILENRIFRSYTPTDIDIYTLKIDFEKSVGQGKLGIGGKSSIVRTDNTFDFFDMIDGQEIKNLERSNNFIYQENVNALYTTYQWQKNKWNLMGGVRLEHTHSTGDLQSEQVQNDELVERDYLNLFPSAGISYQASESHGWRINFSRRIDRPSYQDLNPFEFKLDELTFQKGNAFLNPQYTNSVSLTHTYKQRLNTTLSYSITEDLITEITDTFNADASFITYVNLAKQTNVSLSVSYPFSVSNWWSVYANASAYHLANEADFGGSKIVDVSANVFTFYGQNTFLLPKGMKFELSGFYNSPGIWGGNFKTKSMWSMDVGLQTRLFADKLNLKLAVSDIFKTQRWTGTNELGALQVIASGHWESRQFRATLTYNFGNQEVRGNRNRNTGLSEEQKRVK